MPACKQQVVLCTSAAALLRTLACQWYMARCGLNQLEIAGDTCACASTSSHAAVAQQQQVYVTACACHLCSCSRAAGTTIAVASSCNNVVPAEPAPSVHGEAVATMYLQVPSTCSAYCACRPQALGQEALQQQQQQLQLQLLIFLLLWVEQSKNMALLLCSR